LNLFIFCRKINNCTLMVGGFLLYIRIEQNVQKSMIYFY